LAEFNPTHFRHFFGEQTRRRRMTLFFVILGVVWMGILGYLTVAAHVIFFAKINSAFVIAREDWREWCVVGAGICMGLWMLVTLLLFWSAQSLLPWFVGAHPAKGEDALKLIDAMKQTYEGLNAQASKDMDAQELANVAEETKILSGETHLKWYILESPICNACAVGRSVLKGSILVTRGLLESLNRDELQSVVAHELAHLRNSDAMFVVQALAFAYMVLAVCMIAMGMTLAMVLITAGLAFILCKIAEDAGVFGLIAVIGAVAIVIAGIGYIFTYVLMLGVVLTLVLIGVKAASSAIGQSREYLADACAVQWAPVHCPFALASALKKVAGTAQLSGFKGALAPLWLEYGGVEKEEGLHKRFFSFLIHTHPPVERRLEVIRDMAGSAVITEAQWLRAVRAGTWQRFGEWALPALATALAVIVILTMSQLDLSSSRPFSSIQQAIFGSQEPVPATPTQANTVQETIFTPPPAPEIPSINIMKAVIATGVDTNNGPFGIDTSFYPGNKRLFYYITYNGAIVNSTVFVFKWYQYGNQIKEEPFTSQYASGNVWNSVDYDFQPGQYEAKLYVNGQLLNSTSFNVIENNPNIQREVVPSSEKVENTITPHELIISPNNGQDEHQQRVDRYECQVWAEGQSGYNPTQRSSFQRYDNYYRAMCACLEGRGYTVE